MITKFQLDVLEHTSRNGRYVTGEEKVIEMARQGFLRDHGPQLIAGSMHYFTMGGKGRKALNEHYENLCRFPEPKKKRPASKAFCEWRQFCEAGHRLSFSQFWKEIWPMRRGFDWSL